MNRTSIRTLVLALVVLVVGVSLAFAATETVTGTIQNIDSEKHTLTIMTPSGQTQTYEVSEDMLEDLDPGDKVKLTIEDDEVTDVEESDES